MAGPYLRTNYTVRPEDLAAGLSASVTLLSQWICLRQSWQHDSATGDIQLFSFDGYGRPIYVIVKRTSVYETNLYVRVSLSATGSVFNATILYTGSMGSLAATISYPYEIVALIASR